MTATTLSGPARSHKYLAVAHTGLRQRLSERGELLGRAGFYAVILLIFSRLWAVVIEADVIPGAGATELVWYLAITEWVMLSLPPIHLDIEADVRSGDIAYRLPRPVSYVGARLAEAAGDAALRLVTLGATGAFLAWWLGGGFPGDLRGMVWVIPLGALAVCVGLNFHAVIGLAAFWLQDCSPVYWIWQKLAMVLGGLMLPLEIYPHWLRAIAAWTPFSALMHGPGRMALGHDPAFALGVVLKLLVWCALSTGLLYWVYRRALRVLEVNGG
jgi:ABC-2 type transport system permease protein